MAAVFGSSFKLVVIGIYGKNCLWYFECLIYYIKQYFYVIINKIVAYIDRPLRSESLERETDLFMNIIHFKQDKRSPSLYLCHTSIHMHTQRLKGLANC